jgi:murein DD-endopeptidase MepM/ murein hydrolase activator NlpD
MHGSLRADQTNGPSGPTRGIGVLASSLGKELKPEALAQIVERGKYSPVVIDWAWITAHWGRTDFAAVNKFLTLMAAKKVPVIAMYRPRFIANPTVATQMTEDGKRGTDHAQICYSDAEARRWGIAWGEKILEKCPRFREIIIYNPGSYCQCPACVEASQKGRFSVVKEFLTEAKAAWKAKQPEAKLGVVCIADPQFWRETLDIVDVAHPYLSIREDIDPVQEVENIHRIRAIVKGKMGSCLGKVFWDENTKVTVEKLKSVDDAAAAGDVSYFFWTYETLFQSSLYDAQTVAKTLEIGSPWPTKVQQAQKKDDITPNDSSSTANESGAVETEPPAESTPGDATYSSEQIQNTSPETLLQRIFRPESGYHPFAAMQALTQKMKNADAAERSSIRTLVVKSMQDERRPPIKRYQCCYVLSGSEDEQSVAELAKVLSDNKSDLMRSVAAEALAAFPKNAAAHKALLEAGRKDKRPQVHEALSRHLGQEMPPLEATPAAAPTPSSGVEERAPSGPPSPPKGPATPEKKLPWPFPGGTDAQFIFNNYQQATDGYIHCGLDFMHPAGTPVKAIESGYVAVIATNYPEWTTHHFFIVTPKNGGNKGWCYTHLNPSTFTFKEGDFVKQGQVLGSLVDFSLGKSPGNPHLHLSYMQFTKVAGKIKEHFLIDPLYFFDWKDNSPPSFQPLRFVTSGKFDEFKADGDGVVTVKGKVDILAAIHDEASASQASNFGVPVVMLSISDGTHTLQKLVLDHRGDVGNEKQTRPLYLTWDEKKAFFDPGSFPRYQMLRVTKTSGDGRISPLAEQKCWDTTARDKSGRPLWPNGRYSVNVYAWDIAGNRGDVGANVVVGN